MHMDSDYVYELPAENLPKNKSHFKENTSLIAQIADLKAKIISRGPLPHVSVEQQLEIVDQMSEFPLGRYILEHRGTNGYWTDYMLTHPIRGRITGLNS